VRLLTFVSLGQEKTEKYIEREACDTLLSIMLLSEAFFGPINIWRVTPRDAGAETRVRLQVKRPVIVVRF
jgi:hypothetical protein